ncbi:hypothetical protein [Desulfoscipio geothermicus]|uniref:Uncharacterized protein n=1 Tax=Desulfoscipio geothermicus DSM 3669 TaxID=1121426 RepID=A0A1I6D586_9FIRM|nr:hypothetical protein [Desulfoscipio geothermicus]SFR00573.1 hypothetical protein SAMN05660706_105137 [Desulfoscipio geothermicus DSM 3669]
MYDISLLNAISHQRVLNYRKDLEEVMLLARATPSLITRIHELGHVFDWFDRTFKKKEVEQDKITGYWFDFVNMVLQRYAVLFNAELSAADNLVANFFWRFLKNPALNKVRTSYWEQATPLAFLGRGGARAYYTLPPTIDRPLAIIHMPRAALSNVWRWTALAHETGHDIFFCIDNLGNELDYLVTSVVEKVLLSGSVLYSPVYAALKVNNRTVVVEKTPVQFASTLWSSWLNEVFADLFGLLMCGPSAVATMQELIGFNNVGGWYGINSPSSHPTPLLRVLMNISVLRRLGFEDDAQALEQRIWSSSAPVPRELIWLQKGNGKTIVARASLDSSIALAERVTDAILHTPLSSLNKHSLRQIINFDARDQGLIIILADAIMNAGHLQVLPAGTEPRHLVAAAQLAFNRQPFLAMQIHETVLKLLSVAGP